MVPRRGDPGFPEVIERPKHCGFRMRAPRVISRASAHVAIQRAARYVNASRDARGRDQFRNDRDEPRQLTRASRARPDRALARLARGCRRRAACARRWAAATGEQFQKGYILPPGALEQIPIGASQDQVLIVMGTPSTVATLNGEVFYYISQRSERKVAFMNQKVVDQRVIAIYFDKNRQVQRLANYGLQDGKIFDFISRTTPTSGQEMSYLTPLFKLLSFN